MTKTIEQTKINISDIQAFASQASNDVRIIDKMETGQAVRQGDVYLRKIEGFNSKDYKETNERKLAPGNTPGSRHYIDSMSGVKIWTNSQTNNVVMNEAGITCLGPVIEATKSFKVTHPEHSHFYLPEGTYQVSYQVDPATMRRVLD